MVVRSHQLFTERKLKMKCPPTKPLARQIVAEMIYRMRFARAYLRSVQADGCWPEAVISDASGAYTEAHNAAESARRILYHGVDAL
jgi:hypothetical protein